MKKFFSIKSKIFISHFFLILLLIGGLSYNFYQNSLSTYINSVINFYKNSSSSIISYTSLAISGANYGNLQLPSFTNELIRNEKLLYLNISGRSDYTNQEFNAVYTKEYQTIYRNSYPKKFKEELDLKLERFKAKLNNPKSDKVKLNFLIERTKDAINQYNQNVKLSKGLNLNYDFSEFSQESYVDFSSYKLYLSLPTHNKNGGTLLLIYDISEAKIFKDTLLKDLFTEFFIALVISIIILNILSNKIVSPLNQLSEFMSNDFKTINTNNTPALKQKDEIGILSNRFKILIETIQKTHQKTEKKAYFDNLTNVYNRYKFDEVFNEELLEIKEYNHNLSIVLIDIDNFKSFNDNYGHIIGDEVLIMVAQTLKKNIRQTDLIARWGGEEFVILLKNTSIKDANIISNKLREKIEKLQHKTAGNITASFGVSEYQDLDTLDTILKRCDKALYKAKANGRNKVEYY